jgi:large subunit ribosomal protein L19
MNRPWSPIARLFRTRATQSRSSIERYTIHNRHAVQDKSSRPAQLVNSVTHSHQPGRTSWPPALAEHDKGRITKPFCRKLLKEIEVGEIARMKKLQPFVMPRIRLGDLVQVRYELSRSQQTFSVFEGYCIKIAKKGLAASFALKNTYDGVAVEQMFPFYSPRLLDVRMVKSVAPSIKVRSARQRLRLTDRNYRYRWQYYVRHLYSEGFRVRWRQIRQHPGVMSLEPRIKRELANLRRQYAMMRAEAGLPAYIWPGPYQIHMRQSREVSAERMRRMLVYAWDAKRQEHMKRKENRSRWGRNKLTGPPVSGNTVRRLPRDHVLSPGNLPS